MPEIMERQDRSRRHVRICIIDQTRVDGISPPCRYRKELAGFHVCQATNRMAVVTGTDCGKCPVPGTLERIACIFLRAEMRLAPRQRVRWICGATDETINPDDRSDCGGCLAEQSAR